MKKKILSLCAAMFLMLGFSISVSAETSGTCGENVTWVLDDNGTLTISGTGDMENEHYNSPWENYNVVNVIIGDGVTSIGDSAFYNCDNLISISIGKGVASIGGYAFYGCESLENVYISDIAAWCNINFNDDEFSNPLDADNLYLNDVLVTELVIPNGVTKISDYAFYRCNCITSMVIPDSVTSIGKRTFYGSDSLTSVTIGKGVTSIGIDAFLCLNLESVYISDIDAWCNIEFESEFDEYGYGYNYSNPLSMADRLYLNNKRVTSVTIPDGVTEISSYLFSFDSLTSVTIPDSVVSINDYAFDYCTALENITIPGSVSSIGYLAFRKCESLTSVTIEKGVTSIGESAFYGCSSLKSITIPDSITIIGEEAFEGCYNIESTYITDITAWCNIAFTEDYLGNCNANPLSPGLAHLYLDNELVTDLIIPDSVTSIKNHAFHGCHSLTSITIPNSVTSIGKSAFCRCVNLESAILPDNMTSIGKEAFRRCDNLESIVIPNGITKIDESTFNSCNSLMKIFIPNSLAEIEASAFNLCKNLRAVEYGGNQTAWEEIYIGIDNDPLSNAKINYNSRPENVSLTDNDYLTYTVNGDGNIVITSCVSTAKKINIPTQIDGLTVTEIGTGAFKACSKLTSVTIPDTVTSIGERAFDSCSSLKNIVIPEGVTSIQPSTFYCCSNLISATIPKSVTTIGNYAFYGCSSFTDIYYLGTEQEFAKITVGNGNGVKARLHCAEVEPTPTPDTTPEPDITPTPAPNPTYIPMTQAVVTKTETDSAWSFDVEVEEVYEGSSAYVAVYDGDNNLVGLNSVLISADDDTSVDVNKIENAVYAKVFVWTNGIQPTTIAEKIELITVE